MADRSLPLRAAAAQAAQVYRLLRGYFAFAAAFLVIAVAGLVVHGRLTDIQAETARDNQQWAHRAADYSEIGRLAARLDSPANDVFETDDVATARARLTAARAAFDRALVAAREEVEQQLARDPVGDDVSRIQWRRLQSHLTAIADHAAAMVAGANEILAGFDRHQTAGVGARMAVMDRHYTALADQAAGLGYTVREIQEEGFARDAALARRLSAFEYGLAATTLLFLCGVIVYGTTIGRRLAQSAREREGALAEARANEARTAAILSSALDAVVTIDAAGRITEFNPAACRIFGCAREAVIGRDLADTIIPAAQRAAHRAGLARYLATGETRVLNRRIEVRALRADGSEFSAELAITPFADAGAQGFCAYVRDISAQLAAEGALRDGEARLRSIVDGATDAIVTADERGVIQSWNAAAVRIFGYTAEEAIGRNVSMLAGSPHGEQHDEYLSRYLAGGPPRIIGTVRAVDGRRRDGTLVPLELAVSDVPLEGGRIFSAVVRDVTARRQAEAEILAAKEAAEAATRAKSLFLANMSHEIRTPMNGVIGMTSLLLDTPLTSEQRDFTTAIRASADALLTVINDILDFSKIESGKLELDAHAVDVRGCLEGALDLVAPQAAAKGLDLAYQIDATVPEGIVGDGTRLRQILVNLLSNAVKFTEAGEVTATVRARPAPAGPVGAVEVEFRVADSGIGIPADRMGRLFQSFSQVDPTTTRQFGGTGLGLAICRRLTELMGGHIQATSTPGRGSCFTFTIVGQPASGRPRDYLGAPPPILAERAVLVVDDSPTNRRIVTLQTESWGMRPFAAVSGAEALQWIDRGDRFDLGVLDLHMPEMDGLALARALRARGVTMPLVLLSSLGSRVDEGAFDATLTKPVKPSQLFDAILGVLAPVRAAQPAVRVRADAGFDRTLGARAPLRILLAEDNAINQKVAVRVLERMGYRADLAGNGLEVLEALERQPYDVVLLDVQMPEMDGLTAAREIRARRPAHRPWLVAMTANAMEGDRQTCLAAGMDDYLSKPVQAAMLAAALERAAAALGIAAAPVVPAVGAA